MSVIVWFLSYLKKIAVEVCVSVYVSFINDNYIFPYRKNPILLQSFTVMDFSVEIFRLGFYFIFTIDEFQQAEIGVSRNTVCCGQCLSPVSERSGDLRKLPSASGFLFMLSSCIVFHLVVVSVQVVCVCVCVCV